MKWPSGKRPCFVGVGYTPCRRYSGRTLSHLALEAALGAVADAGLSPQEIDGLSVYPEAPFAAGQSFPGIDAVDVVHMMQIFPLENVRWYSQSSGPLAVTSVIEAANALAAGLARYVLIWRALRHPAGRRYNRASTPSATGRAQFGLPYGHRIGSPGSALEWQALHYARYMEKFKATREQLATLIVNSNRNAQMNENAAWHGRTINRDDYLNARMISEPLSLYDCDMPVDGAACVVMTTEDRAKDTPHPGGYVTGYALSPVHALHAGTDATLEELYDMEFLHARNLYESAGVTARDVDLVHVYDGFSPMVWNWLEAFGFCGIGEAAHWTQGGRIELTGEKPLNTSGGSLGEGRLHGMTHIAETARQMMGTAGRRQVKNAEVALCQVGPFHYGASFICTRT